MKIYEGQGPVLEQAKTKPSQKGAEEIDFKTIMDQTLRGAERGKEPGGNPLVPPPGCVEILQGANGIEISAEHVEKRKIISAIQQTLDLVEFYAGKLGDPSVSAQGMTPLVDHLEEKMELLRGVGSSPGLPDRVRPLISDLTLTIGTEVAKFRRGDYA